MTRSRVSVIVPTYNRAELVTEAVRSALTQTYPNVEVIVVDDGSTDNTREALEPYLDRIIYFRQVNRGRSAARNEGIRISSGRYLAFLDSDDLFPPDKLEIQAGFLDEHPEVDLVYGNGYTVDGEDNLGPLEPHVTPLPSLDRNEMTAHLLRRNLFAPVTALVRKDALGPPPYFDERLAGQEDWDLWIRLVLRGGTICFLDEKVGIYRRHETNTEVVDPWAMIRDCVAICAKIVQNDLDAALPPKLRQDFRVDHLAAILWSRSPFVITSALTTILLPGNTFSPYGARRLASKTLSLSLRAARLAATWLVSAPGRGRPVIPASAQRRLTGAR